MIGRLLCGTLSVLNLGCMGVCVHFHAPGAAAICGVVAVFNLFYALKGTND